MKSVILDTGPCLNFLAINQGRLLYQVLEIDTDQILVPREVADEISDKATDDRKFGPALRNFQGLSRERKFQILESDAINDPALVRAIKRVSTMPPSELLAKRRQKDRGEIMVVAHALKLRDDGYEVKLVIDDGDGRRLAKRFNFEPIRTTRIFALAGNLGLLDYSETKKLYEKLRPSNGGAVMDSGLPHWTNSGLADRRLFQR